MQKPKAFISWSTADRRIEPIAELYREWINSLFGGRIDLFFSREIPPGAHSSTSIFEALDVSEFGFIFLSKRTARNPWVLFESGYLKPQVKKNRVFPLLLDMTFAELREICPPLGEFQAIGLHDKRKLKRLMCHIGEQIYLSSPELTELLSDFEIHYSTLQQSVNEIMESYVVLSDNFKGVVEYNDNIKGSLNFQIPQIFRYFRHELFLVGINLNFLLNLKTNTGNFRYLLDALAENRSRKIRILDIIGNLILNNKFRSVLYPPQAPLSPINNYKKLISLTPVEGATVNT